MARLEWKEFVLEAAAFGRREARLVEAQIRGGLSDTEIADYESNWRSLLTKARWPWQDLKAQDSVEAAWWATGQGADLPSRSYALEIAGCLEGLLRLKFGVPSRFGDGGLVYIDRLIAAPWNQRGASPRRYCGVGPVLLKHAIGESFRHGWEGRVGLHSLDADSSAFYHNCQMPYLGYDEEYMMDYFEFPTADASAFCLRG